MSNNGTADTPVGGIIDEDTIWTLVGSPYIVEESVLVKEYVTLTIEPGVEVRFDIDKALQINGTLVARGTNDNMITFTSNQPSPSEGDWMHILFTDTSTDAIFDDDGNYLSGCILEYVICEYGTTGVKTDNSSPFVNLSTFQFHASDGINVFGAAPVVSNNNVNNNGEDGIYISGSNPVVSNNNIHGNGANGIYNISGGGVVSNNNIHTNGTSGIFFFGPYEEDILTINNNTIYENDKYGIHGRGEAWDGTPVVTVDNNNIYNNLSGGIFVEECHGPSADFHIISNVVFSNQGTGICMKCGYWTDIINNIIANNVKTGDGGGLEGQFYSIENNIIANNSATGEGGAIYDRYGSDIIRNNQIVMNNSSNAIIATEPDDLFINNTVTQNETTSPSSYILLTGPSYRDAVINFNNLHNNITTYTLYNTNGSTDPDFDATQNYWGTTVETEIQAMIYDWFDDATKGIVNYEPWLETHNVDAPISPPTGLRVIEATIDSITIDWDENPETDLAGYKVYWDTDSGYPYANAVDVGNVISYTLTDLTPGETYYIAVTAYDSDYDPLNDDPDTIVNENQTNGNESWYSKEVEVPSELIPPVAVPGGPYSGKVGEPIEFNGSESYDADGIIVSWVWDFGDETPPVEGEIVTHTYDIPPEPEDDYYTVTLTVTDNDGLTDSGDTEAYISPLKEPVPDIKVNGEDGPLSMIAGESANVSIALDPGDWIGERADWWVGIMSPYGTFWLISRPIRLFEMPERSILEIPLSPGLWFFFFVLDDKPDRIIGLTWYDYVAVAVSSAETLEPQTEEPPDYEAIFQEKMRELMGK